MGNPQRAPLLRVAGIRKRFGRQEVLRGVDLEIDRGEVVGLIGGNGTGKTTLFHILSGFIRADAGTFEFCGRDLSRRSADQRARAGLVRTFQEVRVPSRLSVLENALLGPPDQHGESLVLGLFLRPLKTRRQESSLTQRSERLVQELGLAGSLHEPCGTLSHGQQKLASFAAAISSQPDLLMLDEPLSGLAPDRCDKVMELVRTYADQGRGVLIVEHLTSLIAPACNRLAVLEGGVVSREGPPDEVLDAVQSDTRMSSKES